MYKEIFKTPELTDAILLSNYAQTILVIDEVCKEGLPEHMNKASIMKALVFKVRACNDYLIVFCFVFSGYRRL